MRIRLLLALLTLLAILGGVRILSVGYFADDRIILAHVHRSGNLAAWTSPWLGTTAARFHRPLFTGLYALELALFGPDPFPAHLHHLAWHVGAVLLLFWLIRRLGGGPWAAFGGALLFAWSPFATPALGWLASRTGTVAATLTLLSACAWLRWRGGGGRGTRWLALLGAVLAALTKESGYLAFLAPPTIDLVLDRRRLRPRAMARDLWPFLAAGSGLLLLRHQALGTLGGGYGAPDGLLAGGDVARRSLEAFADACLQVTGIAPSRVFQDLSAAAASWVPLVCMLIVSALLLAALLKGRRTTAEGEFSPPRALLLLALLLLPQLVLLLLAAGPALNPLNAQRWYAVLAFVAAMIGVSAGALGRRALAPILFLTACAGWGAWKEADVMRSAGRLSDRILAVVDETVVRSREDTDEIFVVGLPENVQGIPLFWWGLEEAFRPPFRERPPPFPIYPVHRNLFLREAGGWGIHPPVEALDYVAGRHPLQVILELKGEDFDVRVLDYPGLAPRGVVEERLRLDFPGPRLEARVVGGVPAELRGDATELRIAVESSGLKRVDFFVFIPGKDLRIRCPVEAPLLVKDLLPWMRDLAFVPDRRKRVLVLPVGIPRESAAPVRLGPLFAFLCRP